MSERKEIGEYQIQDKVVSLGGGNFVVISAQSMNRMEANAQKMGEMILQLGTMIGTMQHRLDQLEAQQAAVTISHGDAKQLMARIRWKAAETCRKYNLQDKDSPKIFRAAIKKDVLKRYQVKDLHDLPAAMLPAAEKQVDSWTDIRLLMERRVST